MVVDVKRRRRRRRRQPQNSDSSAARLSLTLGAPSGWERGEKAEGRTKAAKDAGRKPLSAEAGRRHSKAELTAMVYQMATAAALNGEPGRDRGRKGGRGRGREKVGGKRRPSFSSLLRHSVLRT